MATILGEEYVTIAEAARLLQVHPSTIRRWIDAGDLPAHRLGHRRVFVKRTVLDTLMSPMYSSGAANERRPEHPLLPRLTPEEQRRGLEAVERARRSQAEQLAQRGGVPYPSSWEIINELRDERSRQLG